MALKIEPSGKIKAGVSRRFSQRTLEGVAMSVGAGGEAGHASFAFGLSFAPPAGDRLTRVDLTVTLTVKMPVWSHYSSRPKPERKEWDRFYKALRYHEDGHIKIFKRESRVAFDRLKAATPATINTVLAAEEQRIQEVSDRYDEKTDHGLKQQTPHGTTVIKVP